MIAPAVRNRTTAGSRERAQRLARASTSDASVGVAPRPSRAPTRAGSGGSRYVDASVGQASSAKTSPGGPSRTIAALAHDDDALERLGHEPHVVADRDDRPALGVECRDDRLDPRDAAGVLAGRRLVEDHDRRPHREDRRESEELPAREAQVVRVRGRIGVQPGRGERGVDGRVQLRPAEPRFRGPNATSARTLPAKIWRSGSWNARPTFAASWATRSVDASTPSTRTRPSVGRSRPLKWRTSVDLPDPFWPTIATRSPRRSRARRRRRPGCRPGRRRRGPRAVDHATASRLARPPTVPRSRPAAVERPRQPHPRRWLDADRVELRDRSRTSAAGPVEDDPAAVDRDDPGAQPVEQVGLVLGDQQRRAAGRELAAAPRRRVASRPGRAGPSARRGSRGAAASRAARRSRRAGPGRPTAVPGRGAGSARSRSSAIAARVRSTVSATSRPRFIGPSATSSKTVAAIPDRCVFGFWNPTTTRVASSCVGRPGHRLAVDRQRPGQRPADRRRREPRGDEAERRLAGLVRPDEPDDLAVGERQVDVVEDRRWRSPRSDTRRPSARSMPASGQSPGWRR